MTYLTLSSNCCAHLESRSKRSNERQKRPTAPVAYVLFDLLWVSGRDLTGKPVVQRRDRLQEIISPVAGIQVGGYLEKRGVELFELAKEKGVEGIIAKRKSVSVRRTAPRVLRCMNRQYAYAGRVRGRLPAACLTFINVER
jgi:hypothetical protein